MYFYAQLLLYDSIIITFRGVLPSPLRKKLLERAHQKSKKSKDKDRSSTSDIITGQQVGLIHILDICCCWCKVLYRQAIDDDDTINNKMT